MAQTMLLPTGRFSARDVVRAPGLISLSRLVFAALFPFAIARPGLWALALLGLAGASDVLDGWVARRFHRTTPTGAVLDGVTDKIFALTVVVTLVIARKLSGVEALFLCTRELGELVLAVKWRLAGLRLYGRAASVGGKVATILQYAAIIAIVTGATHRDAFIATAAVAGVIAVMGYWRSELG